MNNGRKDYAWLKDRYTVLMGRAPEEKDLARLMKVKDVLGIDYDDPAILHLLAFEYYGQLYEQMPEKIERVIVGTEAYAGKHFEQQAAEMAARQVGVITRAAMTTLDKLVEGGNKVLVEVGERGQSAVSTFLLNEFHQEARPAFLQAASHAREAVREIRQFVKWQKTAVVVSSAISGVVSGLVVLGLAYWVWGRP